jgi:hypothetical protein
MTVLTLEPNDGRFITTRIELEALRALDKKVNWTVERAADGKIWLRNTQNSVVCALNVSSSGHSYQWQQISPDEEFRAMVGPNLFDILDELRK